MSAIILDFSVEKNAALQTLATMHGQFMRYMMLLSCSVELKSAH